MDKWQAIGTAFENLGMNLRIECENMSENCEFDSTFDELYTNYAQLLETIKVQRQLIGNRFEELDRCMNENEWRQCPHFRLTPAAPDAAIVRPSQLDEVKTIIVEDAAGSANPPRR